MPHVVRGLLNGPARSALNTVHAEKIAGARCAPPPSPPRNLPTGAVLGTLLGCAAVGIISVLTVASVGHRRPEHLRPADAVRDGLLGPKFRAEARTVDQPVFGSASVSLRPQAAVVVALVGTTGMFVLGMAARGSAVHLVPSIAGRPVLEARQLRHCFGPVLAPFCQALRPARAA